MTRREGNRMVVNEIIKEMENKPNGTFEEIVTLQLGTISAMLTDISMSLAIIADKAESEE